MPSVRIACTPQVSRNLFRIDLFTVAHGARQGVNLRRIAEHRRAEALLDDAVVLDVVVRKETGETYRQDQKHDQSGAQHGIAGQAANLFSARSALAAAFRNSDLNAHGFFRVLALGGAALSALR